MREREGQTGRRTGGDRWATSWVRPPPPGVVKRGLTEQVMSAQRSIETEEPGW